MPPSKFEGSFTNSALFYPLPRPQLQFDVIFVNSQVTGGNVANLVAIVDVSRSGRENGLEALH